MFFGRGSDDRDFGRSDCQSAADYQSALHSSELDRGRVQAHESRREVVDTGFEAQGLGAQGIVNDWRTAELVGLDRGVQFDGLVLVSTGFRDCRVEPLVENADLPWDAFPFHCSPNRPAT